MAHNPLYPTGSRVRISDEDILRQYMRPIYKFHHPVAEELIKHAGTSRCVASASMYFGGDQVYVLDGLPNVVWREECLVADTTAE